MNEKSEKKAIFINTASQIVVRIATLVFTFISVKLLTNYLGTEGYGTLNTITSYVNYFLVVADLGLFSVTVREISKNPSEEKKIISNVFTIRLVSSLVAALIAIFILLFTPYRQNHELFFGVIIACGFLFFNLMGSIGDMILQYRLKMQYSALAEFLSKILSLVALVVVILLKGNFLWVVFSAVTLSGVLIFIFKWQFARKYTAIKLGFDKKLSAWIFNLAWPMGIVFIANNLYFRLDSLMLFVFKGAGAVGIYAAAYKILEVTVFFGSYFASSLKPTLSKNIAENRDYLKVVIEKSVLVTLLLSLPITVVCMVWAKDIVVFFSNISFESGGQALIILAMALPFLYLDVLLGEILIANDEKKLLLKISGFILALNFTLNMILIPKYSFMGAAYGTLISEIVLFFIFFYYTKKILVYAFDFIVIAKIISVAALTLIFSVFIRDLKLYFLVETFASVCFFFGLTQLFRIFDLKNIRSMLK